jgi:hypothetical protein
VPTYHGDPIVVDEKQLDHYLGKAPFDLDRFYKRTPVGVAMGLAWTSMGGSTLYIECNRVSSLKPGAEPSLTITGTAPFAACRCLLACCCGCVFTWWGVQHVLQRSLFVSWSVHVHLGAHASVCLVHKLLYRCASMFCAHGPQHCRLMKVSLCLPILSEATECSVAMMASSAALLCRAAWGRLQGVVTDCTDVCPPPPACSRP